MIKMTDEMRELIDNALANRMPCILATASKSGQPNTSYRGSMMVFDDAALACQAHMPCAEPAAYIRRVVLTAAAHL
jgi:hypothetical protein